ncbi:SDR family NAD(P)-dependent oxidoreductase, partial [Streptomyces scabiei]
DVTDSDSASAAIAKAKENHGTARLLVNCAGGGVRRVVDKNGPMPLEDFSKIINLNLLGAFNMIRLAVADMILAEPDTEGERG